MTKTIVLTLALDFETLFLAQAAGATVSLVHTLENGETRMRVGPIVHVGFHKIHGHLYFTVQDSVKAERAVKAKSVIDARFFFL